MGRHALKTGHRGQWAACHATLPCRKLTSLQAQSAVLQTVSDVVWEFDALLSTYTQRASMPAPRTRSASAALGGKIYVVGGYETLDETGRPGIPGMLHAPLTGCCTGEALRCAINKTVCAVVGCLQRGPKA